MNLKEIVSCYVSETIAMPDDFDRLRKSFIRNKFSEKKVNAKKWVYKRGAGLALDFNYDSEALEMQVILENVGNRLCVSVGNWGFPFEPLLMKKRFKKNLSGIVSQITDKGELVYSPEEIQSISNLAKKKKKYAWIFIVSAVIGGVLYEIFTRT